MWSLLSAIDGSFAVVVVVVVTLLAPHLGQGGGRTRERGCSCPASSSVAAGTRTPSHLPAQRDPSGAVSSTCGSAGRAVSRSGRAARGGPLVDCRPPVS